MAEEYKVIKKPVKDENGKPLKDESGNPIFKEVKYRIDADFQPTSPSDIVIEYIGAYCEAHNQIDWLCDEVSKVVVDKNGKESKIGFVSVRADFVNKFMPEIKEPKPQKPKKSFHDIILEKYGRK